MPQSKADWVFVNFHSNLARDNFSCGEDALDEYIKKYASQDQKRSQTKLYAAVKAKSSKEILGYYSLRVGQVEFERFPLKEHKKLAKYPVPIVRIGRLAVDDLHQGKGIATSLLMDAFYRIASTSQEIAISHIIVDVKDSAIKFYEKFGFKKLKDTKKSLFISLKTVRESIIDSI